MLKYISGFLISVLMAAPAAAEDMKLAVTTSFHNSGLADILLPEIEADTGIEVHLLVVGTGQALRLGAAGDVDAVLVHSRAAEDKFIADGHATHRREIMYNDFVLIGPAADPANVSGTQTASEALRAIAESGASFVSRGDDSGTHKKEMSLWQSAQLSPKGGWYKSVGAGMGAALNTASGMGAYIMSDRASWLNFGNKGDLKILFDGDPALFNQYAYLPVNPAAQPHVKTDLAQRLENWLVSDRAKTLINDYRIEDQTLFTFNASPR